MRALSPLGALKTLRSDRAAGRRHPAAGARDGLDDGGGARRVSVVAVELVVLVLGFDVGEATVIEQRRIDVF